VTHIRTISMAEATGDLRDTYAAMAARPMPAAYRPPHGGAPNIIRAHSLDAGWMRTTFAISATLHGPGPVGAGLSWRQRELLAAATSRTNQCRY
jgi:hypothetical protein